VSPCRRRRLRLCGNGRRSRRRRTTPTGRLPHRVLAPRRRVRDPPGGGPALRPGPQRGPQRVRTARLGPAVGYWAFITDPEGKTLELSHGQEVGLTDERAPRR